MLAQIHLYEQRFAEQPEEARRSLLRVEVLPRHLDELVAQHMVRGFGGVITRLTPKQAAYIQVPVEGPFKHPDYRY